MTKKEEDLQNCPQHQGFKLYHCFMGKVLVVEPIAEAGIEILKKAGNSVDIQLGLADAALKKALKKVEALIVRSGTQVTAELMAAGENLKVVGRAGVGVDNVDINAATELGIMVVNTPEANILSAAEHTMGLILAQARNIPQAHADLKAGSWERNRYSGVELSGKVLGILGLGRVGQMVAYRAQAFGMKVIACDPYVSLERAKQIEVEMLSLPELVARADFLTLHLVSTPETRGMIDAEVLQMAKPGLRLINVSRGEIIDEDALVEAIASQRISGAALDVFANEPPLGSELLKLDEVVATPHLGATTAEAQDRVGITVAEQVAMALAGEFPPFLVNISANAVPELLRPFMFICEQMGQFFAALAEGEKDGIPAVVDVEFQGEIGTVDNETAALAVLTGMLAPTSDQPISYVNARVIAEGRGIEIKTHQTPKANKYVNQIMVSGGGNLVGGTVVGLHNEPRIIQINEHELDMAPSPYMLLLENEDQPGVIGVVGSILGAGGLNIDDMHVGRSQKGAALMVISTDRAVSQELQKELQESPGISLVKPIQL